MWGKKTTKFSGPDNLKNDHIENVRGKTKAVILSQLCVLQLHVKFALSENSWI